MCQLDINNTNSRGFHTHKCHAQAILRIPPFVNDKGKDVNSDWLADQWDERRFWGMRELTKEG